MTTPEGTQALTVSTTQRQQPALPWEITDAIIDNLHDDVEALGACGAVCSEWLVRSRHHMFATLYLWPWRVAEFFELANSPLCTFTTHAKQLEIDDLKRRARSRSGSKESRKGSPRSCSSHHNTCFEVNTSYDNVDGSYDCGLSFKDTFLVHHDNPACFSNVESLFIRNVDWTALRTEEQFIIRGRLAKLATLKRLELHDTTFHDLREVVRIVDVLPSVRHLTANVNFMKHLEYTIISAATLTLSKFLQSVELGTEDGLPVVLSCITGVTSLERSEPEFVRRLELKHVKPNHHQYVRRLLQKSGKNLQHLGITFTEDTIPRRGQDEISDILDLSRLGVLRTLRLDGLRVPKAKYTSVLEEGLATILQRIESSFLDTIHLGFALGNDADLRHINWRELERVLLALHFFGLKTVCVVVNILPDVREVTSLSSQLQTELRLAMPELANRGVLKVSANTNRRSTVNRGGWPSVAIEPATYPAHGKTT
ncbi:hypothetical protein CPB83DRAFT_903230 [Crepidotus variabilis]|uniref:Uncharacterized protein n=1 Tax=Crepidotus variabilis TaxID=179855 RepID=A0A9P6JUB8_9AGAR|nr:hypothetical protein CPB83DRAFT_903230 [Crepidotus variabilis]